ncbi:MAG: linear amide C-N hydrolase [Firmicutes bacterium]|nr:linear amide C-N hydrolase [Bacillota bacterium]
MYHSRWKGSHYEAGFRYGSILYKNGLRLKDALNLTHEKTDFAEKCTHVYKKVFPEILDEIRGLADGQNIAFKDMAAFLFVIYCFVFDNKCSCFAFHDNNNIVLGRNSDFLTDIEKLCDSAYYKLDNSYSFVGNTTAMIEMEDGVNEHGLAIGLTFIYPTIIKPGLNAGMLVRYILEKCKTTKEALESLQKLPIASSQTLTMIDKTADMAVVECNCEKTSVIKSKYFVFSTNHFVSDEMKKYQFDGIDDVHSHERHKTLYNTFNTNENYSVDFAKNLLSGTYGFMCQYDRKQGFDTVWSSVYDLKRNKIYRAEGNPSRKNFKEDTRLKFLLKNNLYYN